MSNKTIKDLRKMSVQELLDYKRQQERVAKSLLYEVDNWHSMQKVINYELLLKREVIIDLEEQAKIDRENTPEGFFEAVNNIH